MKLWAIQAKSQRSFFVLPHTVRSTRKEAIQAYKSVYDPEQVDVDAIWERDRQRGRVRACLLYTSPSPRDQRGSRMPSSA